MSEQIECKIVICASCTVEVSLCLTCMHTSDSFFNLPPPFPTKEMIFIFFFFPALKACKRFKLEGDPFGFPPVEIKNKISLD